MFTLLNNLHIKYLAISLFVVIFFGGVYIKGRQDGKNLTEAVYAKQKLEWQATVAQKQSDFDEQLYTIRRTYGDEVKLYRDQIEKLQNNPKVVTKYVDRFIPSKNQCTIPEGFVELHNRSASGQSLDTSPISPEKPSNRTLSNVASTVAENYYRYNELVARLNALQALVNEYQKKQKELTK